MSDSKSVDLETEHQKNCKVFGCFFCYLDDLYHCPVCDTPFETKPDVCLTCGTEIE